MHISHLKISNYRNFCDFEIDLKPFTVIIGENNSGKSNLLNAIGLILSHTISFIKGRSLDINDINLQAVQSFKKSILDKTITPQEIVFPEVLVEIVLTDFDEDQESVVGDWFIDASLTNAKLSYVYHYRNPKSIEWINNQRQKVALITKLPDETDPAYYERCLLAVDFPIKDYEYLIYGSDNATRAVDNYFLKMLGVEILDALRDADKELIASNAYCLLYKILIDRDEINYADLKEGLQDLNGKVESNKELIKIKTAVKAYLDKISLQEKSEDNSVDFTFSSIETVELLKKLALRYGQIPIDISRNGLGRNNLLYIAIVLAHFSTGTDSSQSKCFRLIGIEEPEAHLHPALQEHLAKNIESEVSKKSQILLTSHSTHIINKLPLENTVLLFKDSNGVLKTHYILENIGTTAEEKKTVHYLRKFLDATNSTMFFSRRLILVEGVSEELLIPALFRQHNKKEIAQLHCGIVNVNGLAFSNFLTIVKNGYFIKTVVFTDSDLNSQVENHAENLRTTFKDCKCIEIYNTKNSTFEKDLIDANKSGKGKEMLLSALKLTRPQKGKEYAESISDKDLNLDEVFTLIENYKAEFALNLCDSIRKLPDNLSIPTYIADGFDALFKEAQNG